MKFFTVVQNVCGGCTMCCKLLGIIDMEPPKPKDVWCRHAQKGVGCAIYETRPLSCREYQCLWLQLNMAPEFRPDKIHGTLAATNDGQNIVLHEDTGWPGHARYVMRDFIGNFTKSGQRWVAVVCGTSRTLIAREDLLKRVRFDTSDPDPTKHAIVEDAP